MQCPIDKSDLVMTDRQGIEIDYCPQCRGVWLDRGELDKMIERSGTTANMSPPAQSTSERREYEAPPRHNEYESRGADYNSRGYDHKKHKKENFLGDLFDF